MLKNKNGHPGRLHSPDKGVPRGPSKGRGGQQKNVMGGCFNRDGRDMPCVLSDKWTCSAFSVLVQKIQLIKRNHELMYFVVMNS